MANAHPMTFKGPIEGYVVNFLTSQYWRVAASLEFDDALQEARLVFCEVSLKYPEVEDRHLMALFKTAWSNRFVDLAKKDTKHRQLVSDQGLDQETGLPVTKDFAGDLDTDGMLLLLIEQAPSEVRTVLSLFLNAPSELLELAVNAWKFRGRRRAEGNQMLNECLGLPSGSDPLGTVEEYFLK